LSLVEHDWLTWSHEKYDMQRDNRLGFSLQFTQHRQEATNNLLALKP